MVIYIEERLGEWVQTRCTDVQRKTLVGQALPAHIFSYQGALYITHPDNAGLPMLINDSGRVIGRAIEARSLV